jgi:serine/threonine-protein kinase HipA
VITRLSGDKQIFALEQSYIDDDARPTLSLSLKGRSGGLVTSIKPVHRRVPPFFSNLLPEGHLRTYLASQAGVNPEREFFLLAALGADLAGAVTVTPLDQKDDEGYGDLDGGTPDAEYRPRQGALRFSLAGVQLKFSAVMESSGGLTIPAQGIGGSWIVKLPSQRFAAVSENEFAMLALARAIGIAVPRSQLVPVKAIEGLPPDAARLPGNALAVERFDRGPLGRRVHMEDLAQVFGVSPENKYKSVSYANIASVLRAETGEPGTSEFVKRLVFSVLIGNADMHLKNWSLLYPDARTPVLAPAYDFVSTLPYLPGDQLALTFGGSKGVSVITPDQIRRFADKAGLPVAPLMRIVRDTVDATATAWRTLESKDLLPAEVLAVVDAQIDGSATRTVKAFTAG